MKTAPSKKNKPHKKFNTKWETVFSRDLAEFMKKEIIEMCPNGIVDIHMPRRNDDNRLMHLPIIELEFEKDIQLEMKKEKPTSCERCYQFEHSKKLCRSNTDCTEPLQEGRVHNCGVKNLCFYCKECHKTGDKKICRKYTI